VTVGSRHPVLVGAGVSVQHLDDPRSSVSALELMAQALQAAAEDAGQPSILRAVEQITVPRGTWSYPRPATALSDRIGAKAGCVLADLGVPQQSLINDALTSIMSGAFDVVVVVGGEARRREILAKKAGIVLEVIGTIGDVGDERWPLEGELVAPAERDVGAVTPVQQYAMIENALGHAEHQTLDDHQDEIATLYARFDAVAGTNPRAVFAGKRTAEFLRTPGPDNRPLAFPYNKWHATQMNVDQAAALIFCSVEAAQANGIDPERRLFPLVALESTNAVSLSRRREMHRWPAMNVLGRAAIEHLGRPLTEIEHVELYSCFPVAVRVAQRELGLPLDGVPTISGGMAFAGGPLNSFVLHETAEMATGLRAHRGDTGLVSAVSGLLTKPGLTVWSTEPGDGPPFVADLAADVASATASVEAVTGYAGPATIATYTVTYDGQTPVRVVAIADTVDGARCVAVAEDPDLAVRGTGDDLIGTLIDVGGTTFELG
jgi:acetyl-CoA C-acetyltransferase